MNCEEVKVLIHDYVDEILDDYTKSEIENHLRVCDNCFTDYKRLTIYFEKLRNFPMWFEAPPTILLAFKDELLRQSDKNALQKEPPRPIPQKQIKQVEKENKKRVTTILKKKSKTSPAIAVSRLIKPRFNKKSLDPKSFVLTILPLLAILLGYFIYDYSKYNSPWSLKNLSGRIYINGEQNLSGTVSQGESLQTDTQSSVVVLVPKVGLLEIFDVSYLFIDKAKDDDNRVVLRNGKIRVINSETMPDLRIQVGDVFLYDRSGIFRVDIGDLNQARVSVEYGFLEMKYLDKSYFIDENYISEIRPGFRPGTPYRYDASNNLIDAVRKFDFEDGSDESIKEIIAYSREQDILTLLALIPQTTMVPRQQLYQAITSYFPLPKNVTISGILDAEEEMVYRWWQHIEWQL